MDLKLKNLLLQECSLNCFENKIPPFKGGILFCIYFFFYSVLLLFLLIYSNLLEVCCIC